MMHKEMEVCVDGTIANSIAEEDQLNNLRKAFKWLRKYGLKLNPSKVCLAQLYAYFWDL